MKNLTHFLNESKLSKNKIYLGIDSENPDADPWKWEVHIGNKKVLSGKGAMEINNKEYYHIKDFIEALSFEYDVDSKSFDLYNIDDNGNLEKKPYAERVNLFLTK